MGAEAEGKRYVNREPTMVLEIADCTRRISLEFDLDSREGVRNSLHKIDTLVTALTAFREGLIAEAALYRRRERQIERLKAERESAPPPLSGARACGGARARREGRSRAG